MAWAAAVIVMVTVAWWALALWPAAADAPAWLARTRLVCFGVHDNGLPDLSGWLALVGEPLGMLAVLLIGWREGARELVRRARLHGATRLAVRTAAVVLLGAGLVAAWRIGSLLAATRAEAWPVSSAPTVVPVGRPAPATALVDQAGRARTLAELRGRPVLLTFAFAHCETMCPLSVRAVLDAAGDLGRAPAGSAGRREVPHAGAGSAGRAPAPHAPAGSTPPGPAPAIVIITLDPWRDTPARLPALARAWALPADALVLGGSVEQVEAVLDAWQVARSRDPRTGEITHAPVVYVLDEEGRIAFRAPVDAGTLAALVRRL